MNMVRYGTMTATVAAASLAIVATPARAQLISISTVPLASGDQFLIFPSQRLGMAGVSLALDDAILDPFSNPARGARIERSFVFTAPSFYDVTSDNGSGRTLPLGGLFLGEEWFGGGVFTLQELSLAREEQFFFPVCDFCRFSSAPERLSDRSSRNVYLVGMLGRRDPERNLSVGGSLSFADLDAMGGVEHLYAGSQRIDQSGDVLDLRAGLVKEWADERTLDVTVVHNRIDMSHEVTYLEWVWLGDSIGSVLEPRIEENLDRTNTWGAQAVYAQPLAATGWRIGGLLTGNRKSHPKIPNYEIQNIPRDPGDSWAFNLGVGLSRTEGPHSFGFDLIYEPIWSDTWQEADQPIQTATGRTIPKGSKTIENEFSFSNYTVRVGFGHESARGGFQLGVEARSIRYELDQFDNVTVSRREQEESWTEWTPSWGGVLKLQGVHLRYLGRLTTGTGRPGVTWTPQGRAFAEADLAAAGGNILAAPSGPLTLQDADVWTHQVSVIIPLR